LHVSDGRSQPDEGLLGGDEVRGLTAARIPGKAMRLPAISLDRHGFVIEANAAAEVVFDDNIRIKHRRLFVRDPDSRTLLKEAIDQLSSLNAWARGRTNRSSMCISPIRE
jgi:hypothetical protein